MVFGGLGFFGVSGYWSGVSSFIVCGGVSFLFYFF